MAETDALTAQRAWKKRKEKKKKSSCVAAQQAKDLREDRVFLLSSGGRQEGSPRSL